MKRTIVIKAESVKVPAEIEGTGTGDAIWNALPLEGSARLWGEEIYFEIPVEVALEDGAAEVVSAGDLGYWPSGNCFCIFFGPTPASRGDEIRPASAVNVFGRITGDPLVFREVREGQTVTVERAP